MNPDEYCMGLGLTCVHCRSPMPEDAPRRCPALNEDVYLDEVREGAPEPEPPECALDGCDEEVDHPMDDYCSNRHRNEALQQAAERLETLIDK